MGMFLINFYRKSLCPPFISVHKTPNDGFIIYLIPPAECFTPTTVISNNLFIWTISSPGLTVPLGSIVSAIMVMCRLIDLLECIIFMASSSYMQKTHQSALQVQQKAEALLQANHYDMDMIRDCAEKVFLSKIHE